MSLEKIHSLLKDSIGLNPDSVGADTIKRDIDIRMSVHGLNDYGRYLELIMQDPEEMHHLTEQVIVPETWFLRDKKPFDALASYVRTEWDRGEHLNILSLPCSTGEEPYSIAITLMENGMSPSQFSITAIDISLDNILQAIQGRYTDNSFRGTDPVFRDRYFTYTEGYYCLNDNIKNTVSFKNDNMFELDILDHHSKYHIIFCRNLLIYFDRDTQEVAISILGNMLRDKGVLFAGHAESTPYMQSWNRSIIFPNAFAFRKFDDGNKSKPVSTQKNRHSTTRHSVPDRKSDITKTTGKPFRLAHVNPPAPPAAEKSGSVFDSDKALTLANEGHLAEAASLCDEYISNYGPHAEAFMVLALVRNGTGKREEAMDYLRKVIYLQPDHYDALMHLALLAEQSGKTQEASILKTRAERIKTAHKKHLVGV